MYFGIDLGGTKIEGIVIRDRSPDTIVSRKRIATEGDGGYTHIINRIALLVNDLKRDAGQQPHCIGIGTPGTTDPATGLLKNSNTLCLNGRPLQADLEKKLGVKVFMANDANCFALAEYHLGVVRTSFPETGVLFGVIMGTGVGGGIVVNGKVLQGHHGIAGEWGHMFLDESGGDCYCGHTGCVESIISGPALEQFYFSQTGTRRSLVEIINAEKDPASLLVKERLLYFFGKGLAQVVNLLDPDLIVLGGGLGKINFLYSEGLKSVAKHIFNPEFTTPVVAPKLGDSAGVFGAAMLCDS